MRPVLVRRSRRARSSRGGRRMPRGGCHGACEGQLESCDVRALLVGEVLVEGLSVDPGGGGDIGNRDLRVAVALREFCHGSNEPLVGGQTRAPAACRFGGWGRGGGGG